VFQAQKITTFLPFYFATLPVQKIITFLFCYKQKKAPWLVKPPARALTIPEK
jgi:hypothetical protein